MVSTDTLNHDLNHDRTFMLPHVAVPLLNLWYDFEASQYYVGFLENCLYNKMLNCVFPDVTVRINTCNTHINKG